VFRSKVLYIVPRNGVGESGSYTHKHWHQEYHHCKETPPPPFDLPRHVPYPIKATFPIEKSTKMGVVCSVVVRCCGRRGKEYTHRSTTAQTTKKVTIEHRPKGLARSLFPIVVCR